MYSPSLSKWFAFQSPSLGCNFLVVWIGFLHPLSGSPQNVLNVHVWGIEGNGMSADECKEHRTENRDIWVLVWIVLN